MHRICGLRGRSGCKSVPVPATSSTISIRLEPGNPYQIPVIPLSFPMPNSSS
jgi:hypothetical protein